MGLVHDEGGGVGQMDDEDEGGLKWWTVVRRCVFRLCGTWIWVREMGIGCREIKMEFSGCVIVSKHPLGTKDGQKRNDVQMEAKMS